MAANDHPGFQDVAAQAPQLEALVELMGGIAHDINNLLTVIMGAAEALSEDLDAGSDQQDLALVTLRAAERGAELLRRLVDASRPRAPAPKALDCTAMVDAIRPFARQLIREDISLKIQAPSHPLYCTANAADLESAILNLLINARDAMPAGGSLSLRAEAVSLKGRGAEQLCLTPGDYVVFTVRDTGHGMSPDMAERVLEPFFTTKGETGGSGLGLSNASAFARLSGGNLAIASDLGRGSSISIYLPRSTPPRSRLEAVGGSPMAAVGLSHPSND